jgi:hypothetical protein
VQLLLASSSVRLFSFAFIFAANLSSSDRVGCSTVDAVLVQRVKRLAAAAIFPFFDDETPGRHYNVRVGAWDADGIEFS